MAVTNRPDKIPKLTVKFWKDIGAKIPIWVFKDCEKGLMQDNTGKHPLSKQYAKYKKNDMRRFSDKKRLGSPRKLADGTTSTYKQKKFPVLGRSLFTIGKSFATMLLTGDTVKGLKGTKHRRTSVTMKFNPADAPKILGNPEYDIVGLNEKNQKKVKALIIKEFKKNKQKFLKKNITINIGK